jgi:hypothetical protein
MTALTTPHTRDTNATIIPPMVLDCSIDTLARGNSGGGDCCRDCEECGGIPNELLLLLGLILLLLLLLLLVVVVVLLLLKKNLVLLLLEFGGAVAVAVAVAAVTFSEVEKSITVFLLLIARCSSSTLLLLLICQLLFGMILRHKQTIPDFHHKSPTTAGHVMPRQRAVVIGHFFLLKIKYH